MQHHRILPETFQGKVDIETLQRLGAIDAANFFQPDPLLRLIALVAGGLTSAQALSERLKLSNDERDRLVDLANAKGKLTPYLSVREVRRTLYRLGQKRFRDRVLLAWADDAKSSNSIAWRALLALADAWERPRFPLSDGDVLA